MNDFRISRNDDETFTDEDTFVSERRDALVAEWRQDQDKVRDAILDAMFDDTEDRFANMIARLFIHVDPVTPKQANGDAVMADAAATMWRDLIPYVEDFLKSDAETQAWDEWDSRQTGAPE